MNPRPAFMFYPADHRKDAELQSCSLAARGLWMELICIMHQCEPYGSLKINGQPMKTAQIGRLVGETEDALIVLLKELGDAGVYSREEDGTIFSRRMKRDERLRIVRAEAGKKGGNPSLLNHEVNQKDNQRDNLTPKQRRKQKPTLSFSVPVSVSNINNTIPPRFSDYFDILKSIPGYPFDIETDFAFLQEKETDFPTVDILSLLKTWRTYLLDAPLKKNARPRSQLLRQFEFSMKLNRNQKAASAVPEAAGENILDQITAAEAALADEVQDGIGDESLQEAN
jgi:hypothetical protein